MAHGRQDLAAKLLIKPDARVLLLNAPIGYARKLAPLPKGATVTDKRGQAADVVVAFVRDGTELKRLASGFAALEEDARVRLYEELRGEILATVGHRPTLERARRSRAG